MTRSENYDSIMSPPRRSGCSTYGERLAIRLGLRSPKRSLPLLDEWGARHADPDSGLWALTPSCGSGYWELWAPGSADPDVDFPYADAEPHALHQAREGENGEDDLAATSGWLVSWLERVTGARVIDLVEGWSAPYGPVRDREYVIYARVDTGRPA